jgi:plastocyanin
MRFLLLFDAALLFLAVACSSGSGAGDASPTATRAASTPEATASSTTVPTLTAVATTREPSATTVPAATAEPTATNVPTATQPAAPTAPAATLAPPPPSGTAAPIKDYTFPSNQTVPVGSTVVWTNYDSVPHDVTAKDGSWSSGLLGEGKSFSHTFTQPGQYAYACRVHPYMTAVLIVQ